MKACAFLDYWGFAPGLPLKSMLMLDGVHDSLMVSILDRQQ